MGVRQRRVRAPRRMLIPVMCIIIQHISPGSAQVQEAPFAVTAGVFILGMEEQLITGDVFFFSRVLMGK